MLDIAKEDQQKGALDVNYWMSNPQQLQFPNEMEQVGFGVITPAQMPTVKTGTRQEADPTKITQTEIDPFLSTTARLTADAPFQVFSDNQHIYVFRQSVASSDSDMVYKLTSGKFSGAETDQTKYVKDSSNQKVPIADKTLLVDRYVLSGTTLKLPREVRFRRSENKTTPASATDSLGAKDMEGNPFYEPTKELDFIRNLDKGCFSVILLPTEVADIERWQIFAYNKSTKLIDSFNIERGDDGFFNIQGTQLYTSPDAQYKSSVLERKPSTCPFTGLPLVPIVSKSGYAEWALQFDSSNAHVDLGNPAALKITGDQTIEMWIKPRVLDSRMNPFNKSWGGEGTIDLEADGQLKYWYGTSGGDTGTDYQGFSANRVISAGAWVHIAIVRDLTNKQLHWYINGIPSGNATATYTAAKAGTQPVLIGKGYGGNFDGLIDEVRIWNRARSSSEIKDMMNHRLIGDESGLAGYWRFDEGAGTQVNDQTHNGNHGTFSGGGVSWVPSDAPIGEHPGMRRTSFALGDRAVDTGLAARLYYEQEKLSSGSGESSVKQNARVLLTAVTTGSDPNVPVSEGLVLNLSGESYQGGNQWDDFSGRDHHATKPTGSTMPILEKVTNYNNKSFPVMRFRSGDGMAISDSLNLQKPFTAIIVDRYHGATKGRTLQSRDVDWYLGKHNGNNACYMGGAIGNSYAATDNTFTISTATLDGSSPQWYVDGVSKGSTGGSTAPGKLGLCQGGSRNEPSDADIACVLIWDRVLTNSERQTVEKWLGDKYGISVSHTVNPNASPKKYVAAVDLGVSREGKLAQVPDKISLPVIRAPQSGSGKASTLATIATLETEIPQLETQIVTLNQEITTLDNEIQSLDTDVASISTVEGEISTLQAQIASYNQSRRVTFSQAINGTDSLNIDTHYPNNPPTLSYSNPPPQSAPTTAIYNPTTGVITIDTFGHEWARTKYWLERNVDLIVTYYDVYSGHDRTEDSSFPTRNYLNYAIGNIRIRESDSLKASRNSTQQQLTVKNADLADLKAKRDSQLPPRQNTRAQKVTDRDSKQGELNTKKAQLANLQKIRGGEVPPQPMPRFHTDPLGLSVTSGLLSFAYTDSQPYLFDSALGQMTMYFKGVDNQFFSTYYDVNTSRARWSLAAGSGTILYLVSPTSEREMNDTTITIANGGDANHCAVTIQNTKTGLTETWTDVSREVNAFAQVLNGEAGEKIFVGKLNTSLSGTAITTLDLKAGLPRQVPASSTLLLEDSNQTVKLTVSAAAGAQSGSKQITINSATPTLSADAKVYLLQYDYAARASVTPQGYTLNNGSLHVNIEVGQAKGQVSNANANRIVEARSPRWFADAPGSALSFDGTDDHLYGQTPANFEHKGDMTMEAWVRPNQVTGDSRLIHCHTMSSHYSLGLRQQTLNSALSLDGTGDSVALPLTFNNLTNRDFTVEAWVKIAPGATHSEQPILGAALTSGDKNSKVLHLSIRSLKPYLGFFADDLADPTVLTKGQWYHIAFRYTSATKEQAIFVDGTLTSHRTASADYLGTGTLSIGTWGGLYFLNGDIDEVRIWNVARQTEDIQANMRRRLGGQEPGLVGYYHFENRNANDRSGYGHHGMLKGNLTSRNPLASPLSSYVCFAAVGDSAIATTEPVVTNSWHHYAAVYNQSYALKFDRNDYCDAGNESALNLTEDLTIEAFIKLDSLGRKHGIMSKGIMNNGDDGSVPYAFYIDESGKLVLSFEDEDGGQYTYTSSQSLTANTFYRVAVVRKIGQEKLEKTADRNVTYTDKNGNQQSQTFQSTESIDFQDYGDIRFYINQNEHGYARHDAKQPIGNNGPLYIGRSYIANQATAQFQGTLSELRIWSVARSKTQVNTTLSAPEAGLTAWWRFEENAGNIAYDAGGANHARIIGTQWVKNPAPSGSSFEIYRDGQKVAAQELTTLPAKGDNTQFTIGAQKASGSSYGGYYKGALEETRIWKTARRREEILDNLFTRLKGEKADLMANYTFDNIKSGEVKDLSLKSNHLQMPTTQTQKPTEVVSTAPISNDTAQVRSALSGIKTSFQDQISGRPAVVEYADTQRLDDGRIIGVYKRCYAYTKNGKWLLLTGYKVGNLVTEWIGQAQFDPQVVGYIEGAPPVPSENLTEGYYRINQTFNGTSEVTLQESESVNYTISTSKESGFSSGFEFESKLGAEFAPRVITAPMGIGMSVKLPAFKGESKNTLEMEANGAWSGGKSFGSGQTISRNMSAGIGGNWDVADTTKWVNPELTRRFIPANMGFAFVESETADMYALRLEHTGTLVAFRMVPNPDIPKDTNIIPFPINNRYTKQGTLDGRLGYTGTGIALDPDYANATGYGEYSYFKPKEAYQLKKRIEREEQKLKDFYNNFDQTPAGAKLMAPLAGAFGAGTLGAAGLGGAIAAKMGASVYAGPIISGAMIAAGMGTTIGSLIDAASSGDNSLAEKYARRNIVNTYVWTADGGFYEESTQISQVRSESKSGSYSFNGKGTGGLSLEIKAVVAKSMGLSGMLGGSLNLTKSKSEDAQDSFSIDMKLLVPDNLQKYAYKKAGDLTSGVKGVYDGNGNPVSQPGKVDAFRFMTFYLEPQLNNFEDFFGKVIDPIWLEESTHPNAIALRQANQATKKPKCWRIFHRVTFVSRILPDFPTGTGPSLEKKMKDLNIASNYELVRRLDPFVRDRTANWTEFNDAVKSAVQAYLPELSTETELNQITLFLADYYGVVR
ncbi:MAG: LamG-like jellyroll fold domain-containing protein [Cyanobacteria bacterium P01_F01_bin.4]